ncbi:shikimate kinase [soil metagenome]
MKIFLLGLPGSGKTTLGKQLAQRLNLPFVDLDAEIERSEGAAIPKIFEQKKEDYFRKVESNELKKWCLMDHDFVMATGGGAPVYFDNIETLNRAGLSIFLDVPASEIARRILDTNIAERPLFAKAHPESIKDHVEFMRSHRLSFYKKAHYTLSGKSIIIEELLAAVKTGNQQ